LLYCFSWFEDGTCCELQLQVAVTAASGGPLLFTQYAPSAILKPKNRKTETDGSGETAHES
jgi:hypothetical protein